MISKGAVTESQTPPVFSTLFLVPRKDGGQRPVINFKKLNSFISAPHFIIKGIYTLKSLLQKEDWLVKIDLKDAYLSIPISKEHRKYLCFEFRDRFYQFNCHPFGLALAPWVFTKTLKPIASLVQELGIRLVLYIDDILLKAETKKKPEIKHQAWCISYIA
uniref:Reverse transcriptase domain-containing protein n=1 Tax=Amphimedon queenslandica TaxID=400682 RepID=A0A1X7V3L1_AMPQE